MLLVPSGALKDDPFPHHQKQVVSELDDNMNSILSRKDLDDSSKWRLYEQTLQRYNNLHTIAKQPKRVFIENTPNTTQLNLVWMDDIPIRYITSVQRLVDQIENIPEKLRWLDNGEVVVNNSVVSGSDIRDIALEFVKPSSNETTKPRGFYAVSNLLSKLDPLNYSTSIQTPSSGKKQKLPRSNLTLLASSKPKKSQNTKINKPKINKQWVPYKYSQTP